MANECGIPQSDYDLLLEKVDELILNNEFDQAYDMLAKYKDRNVVAVLWRLAK